MARKTLTPMALAKARPPASGRLEWFDTLTPGLCFRVTERGVKSWSVVYRFNGALRRDTIGPFSRIDLLAAREAATHARDLARRGIDPRVESANSEAAERDRRETTVKAVADVFIELYAKQRRWTDLERILTREIVGAWAARPISEITRRDALDLLVTVKRRAPVRANRVLAVLKLFMGWAVEHEHLQGSPVAAISKPTRERPRDRTLSDDEIRAFWMACGAIGWPFGPLFKLLLITAQRRDEIGALRWREFEVGKRLIEIPGERYKANRPHVVPLAPIAVDMIADLPCIGDKPEFVFTTNGKSPVSGYSRAKSRVDNEMLIALRKLATERGGTGDNVELPPWNLHDLRRTARTEMSRIGINADVAERMIGHAVGGLRGRYDKYEFLDERRTGFERWAAHLIGIVNTAPEPSVIRLRRRALA